MSIYSKRSKHNKNSVITYSTPVAIAGHESEYPASLQYFADSSFLSNQARATNFPTSLSYDDQFEGVKYKYST